MDNTEISRKFYALFHTPLGQEVLEHLRKQTVDRSTMPNVAADGNAMAMLMSLREGENNLYRQIDRLIKTGERKERND